MADFDETGYNKDEILEALEGKPKIHVARKSIVKALKSTTQMLGKLVEDAKEKADQFKMLMESNRALLKITRQLQIKMRENEATLQKQGATLQEHDDLLGSGQIEQLFEQVSGMTGRMDNFEENLSKTKIDLQNAINDLEGSTDVRIKRASESIESLVNENEELKDTTNGIKELFSALGGENENGMFQIYADSIVYPEANLTLPMMIKNVQSDFHDATELMEKELEDHQAKLEEFEPKVKLVPKILEVASDNRKILKSLGVEEGDGNNLLKQIQTTKATTMANSAALLEKADAKKITEVIEMKYDEIVEHLQLAISAATDDEDEFKRVAGELRGMVKDLMLNKADRVDMIRLKELVYADNALREDVAHMKITMSSKLEREDVEEIVSSKSDKQDATKTFQQALRRLERKIANLHLAQPADDGTLSGGKGTVYGKALNAFKPGGGGGFKPGQHSGMGPGAAADAPGYAGGDGGHYQGAEAAYQAQMYQNNNPHHPHGARGPGGPGSRGPGPRMGPGGPSLGGGFQIALPGPAPQQWPPKGTKLPRLDQNQEHG